MWTHVEKKTAWGSLYSCEGGFLYPVGTQVKSRRAGEKTLAMPTQQPKSENPPGNVIPEPFLEKALKN